MFYLTTDITTIERLVHFVKIAVITLNTHLVVKEDLENIIKSLSYYVI